MSPDLCPINLSKRGKIMFCVKCGTKIPDNGAFCPICGTKVDTSLQKNGQNNIDDGTNSSSLPPPLEFLVCGKTIQIDGRYAEFTSQRKPFFNDYCKYIDFQVKQLQEKVTAENLPERLGNFGLSVINWIFERCVTFLISNGIYHASKDSLIDACPNGSSHFSELYSDLQEQYIAIVASEEELVAYQKARKAYRGSWQGGGFGLKGALKGAATAGALNIADRALNQLGGAISDSMERSRIRKQKEAVFRSRDWIDKCKSALDEDAEMIYEVAYQMICTESNTTMPPIDRNKSITYIKNGKQVKNPDQYIQIMFMSISAYPYSVVGYQMLLEKKGYLEYSVYQLANRFLPAATMTVLVCNIRDLYMKKVDAIPDTTYQSLDKKIKLLRDWNTFIEEESKTIDSFRKYRTLHGNKDASKLSEVIRKRHTADDGTYFESLEDLDLYTADKFTYEKLMAQMSTVLSLEEKKAILQGPINTLLSGTPCLKTKIFQTKLNKLYDKLVLQIYASKETDQLLVESERPINQDTLDKLLSIAQQGGMDAQYALYKLYYNARDLSQIVATDNNEAFKWCKLAAQQGHGLAQWRLGYLYYMGVGTEKDIEESKTWYHKAINTYQLPAQRGDPVAQCTLGQIFADKKCPMHDSDKALSLYELAAKQNNAEAKYYLGCYYDMRKDYEKAKSWYTSAAEQGYAEAQYKLTYSAFTPDKAERVRFYIQAAENGLIDAQCELGQLYGYGRFVEKDLEKALMWYQRAAAQGYKPAQTSVETIKSMLRSQGKKIEEISQSPAYENVPPIPPVSQENANTGPSRNSDEEALNQLLQEERELQKRCDDLFAGNPTLNNALKKANSSTLILLAYLFAIGSLFIGLLPIGILVVAIAYMVRSQRNKRYENLFYATASDELKAACQARYDIQQKRIELEKHLKHR